MSAAKAKRKGGATKAQTAAKAAFKGTKAKTGVGGMKKTRRNVVAILVGILAVQIVSPATVILLVAGMLPSVVAFLVDTEPGKRSAHCMTVLNLAGVLPVLAMLWEKGATRGAAADILMDPFMWFVMYGAAGIAVLLLTLLPVLMEQVANAAAEREADKLERQMEELAEEWGSNLVQDAQKLEAANSSNQDGGGLNANAAAGRPRSSGAKGGAATGAKGAVRGRRPSSPSAASRTPALRSGAPARG